MTPGTSSSQSALPSDRRRRGPGYGAAILVSAIFFAAIAPTLRWLEFSGGSENLVAAAVVEMLRGGPKLLPNLQGEPRIKKPPLTTWIAASSVKRATFERTTSRDQATRDLAFHDLAFQIRWTSLLAACGMLLAVYSLGRTITDGDGRVGIVAMLMAGTSVMFLRFGRAATTDVHLALWVSVANACFAAWAFRGRAWLGALGGGAALGLAFMSKGPVALLQSVVPFALFVAWRAWDAKRLLPASGVAETSSSRGDAPRVWLPLLCGAAVFLLVAMPWYVAVAVRNPHATERWYVEVFRSDVMEQPPDAWYIYFAILLYVAPWVPWFIAGLVTAAGRFFGPVQGSGAAHPPRSVRPRLRGFPVFSQEWDDDEEEDEQRQSPPDRSHALVLTLLLVIVPVLVMTLFKDKKERYLFPLLASAANLAALSLVVWIDSGRPRSAGATVVRVTQWLTLGAFAIGAPVAIAMLKTVEGEPWVYPATAAILTAIGSCIVLTGVWLEGRRPYAAVIAGVLLMLALQYPVMDGYKDYNQGRAELKPLADRIWSIAPDADVYELDIPGRLRTRYDLPIYLGRITRKTADPLTLEQGPHPVALVYFSGRKVSEPQLAPPWKFVAEGSDDHDRWKLYLLPAK